MSWRTKLGLPEPNDREDVTTTLVTAVTDFGDIDKVEEPDSISNPARPEFASA